MNASIPTAVYELEEYPSLQAVECLSSAEPAMMGGNHCPLLSAILTDLGQRIELDGASDCHQILKPREANLLKEHVTRRKENISGKSSVE